MTARVQTKHDLHIQQEVLREMNWDTRVEDQEITVAVVDGIVSLTGVTDSYAKKLAAQDAAHRVAGVLDVVNDIQVRIPRGKARSDTEIAKAVRSALEWDVWVPEERIKSTVSDGWVTLEGEVEILRERADAERTIRRLAGVCGVTNKIEVRPPNVAAEDLRE
ncbi:MAG TPA: BON domain-containing protein, partial [Blastocatellia bacterium]|nr:BON domain-containing protein [Blastocatellia bacterium]